MPKSASSRGGPGDHQGVGVVVPGARRGRDQAELLELVEELLGDLGDLEQLAARQPHVVVGAENDSGLRQPVGGQRDRRARSGPPARSAGGSRPRSMASRCSPMTFSGR